MKLTELIGLEKGSIVSVVGFGGKTTLIFTLAKELRKKNKVLVTTTTKIFVPQKTEYDFLTVGKLADIKLNNQGIYVYGTSTNNDGKLIGIDRKTINSFPRFDYTLIEADGSKQKAIKGWNKFEPVIVSNTSLTVGVICLDTLGKHVNEDVVFRVEEFCDITGAKVNDVITINHIISLIMHPNGLFKNAMGKKVLLINKVETVDVLLQANVLVNLLRKQKEYDIIDQVIIGSLGKQNYEFYGR